MILSDISIKCLSNQIKKYLSYLQFYLDIEKSNFNIKYRFHIISYFFIFLYSSMKTLT